jgi:hypothetical protein
MPLAQPSHSPWPGMLASQWCPSDLSLIFPLGSLDCLSYAHARHPAQKQCERSKTTAVAAGMGSSLAGAAELGLSLPTLTCTLFFFLLSLFFFKQN